MLKARHFDLQEVHPLTPQESKAKWKTKSHRIQDLVWWGTWRTLWILKNHDFIIIYDLYIYIYYNIMYKPKPTQNNCLSMIQRHRNPPCPAVLRAGWTARESSASAATCAVAALKCRFRAAPRRALNLRWGADDGRWRGEETAGLVNCLLYIIWWYAPVSKDERGVCLNHCSFGLRGAWVVENILYLSARVRFATRGDEWGFSWWAPLDRRVFSRKPCAGSGSSTWTFWT